MLITKKIKFSASRVTNMMGSDDDRPITEFGTTLRRGRLFVGEAPIATYFGFPGPSLVNNSDLIERNVRPKGCCTYVHCMSLLLSIHKYSYCVATATATATANDNNRFAFLTCGQALAISLVAVTFAGKGFSSVLSEISLRHESEPHEF